jgi:hypothetical protein
MTSQSKINTKSKQLMFKASQDYNSQMQSTMPCEEIIVTNEKYPDYLFLVHKNMIFERGSIADSSYNVYSFDKEGNYVRKEDMDRTFFRNMKVLKKL